MFLPLAMCPATHVPYQYLEAKRFCPLCQKEFTTGGGVVYAMHFTRNGTPSYGHVLVCSTECILVHVPHEGRA